MTVTHLWLPEIIHPLMSKRYTTMCKRHTKARINTDHGPKGDKKEFEISTLAGRGPVRKRSGAAGTECFRITKVASVLKKSHNNREFYEDHLAVNMLRSQTVRYENQAGF